MSSQALKDQSELEPSEFVTWNIQTWVNNGRSKHGRITHMISFHRIFDLQTKAQAFLTALTSEPEPITSKVGAKRCCSGMQQ